MRTVLLTAFQPSCPWQVTRHGRAQSHWRSQWPVLAPPFCMSNHHSWHVLLCPSHLPSGRVWGTCSKHWGKIPPTIVREFPQENRTGEHTAEDTYPLPADWKHISDGKGPSGIQGLHRSHQGSRGVPYIQGRVASAHFATVHCFVPLGCVREQSLFYRKQPGNTDFNKACIPTLFAHKSINVSGWFSSFTDNKVICS